MRRRKILIALISLAASLLTLLTQETLAYYAVLGEATNVITTGEVDIRIVEKLGEGDTDKDGVYIMPGMIISRRVSVKNTGKNPCWLRIRLVNGINDDSLSADITEPDINLENWIDGRDGYYYYEKPLDPGSETEYLFTEIKISGSADNAYLGKMLKMTVLAYAVQSQNNAGDPLSVSGWPADRQVVAADVGGGA